MLQIISAYICGIITTIEVIIFGKLVLNKKIKLSKRKLFLFELILSLTYAIISLLFIGIMKSLIIFMLDIIVYRYIFNINNQKSIILTFIYMIILLIPEAIIFIFTKLININDDYLYNIFAGSILGSAIICIIFILALVILKKWVMKLINTEISTNTKIIIYSISVLICILIIFYKSFSDIELNADFIVSIFVMILFISMLFGIIRQTIDNNKLIKKYDKLLEFMTTYENEIEKQRVLRHETKNEFLSIRGKIHDKQNNKEIIAYIDEILKEKIEVKQEEYAKFGYLPANGIKGLCYLKTQEAQDKGLNTAINISKRIKNSNIYGLDIKEQRDLGKILGVFLDNAIEASIKSKAKEFGIESYLNLDKQCQIIIANSYDEKIDLDKIGKEMFSTKGKNRGHGLLLVKHIVGNNNIFETKTDIINGLYIQTVTITKKTTKKKPSTK